MPKLRYFLPLILLVLLGCGDDRVVLPTAPVAGTVTYQEKPLSEGRIVFYHPSGQAVGADISADGSFNLEAFQGKNQVVVILREPDRADPNLSGPQLVRGKSLVPERYGEPGSTDLSFDVKPDENKAEFTLTD